MKRIFFISISLILLVACENKTPHVEPKDGTDQLISSKYCENQLQLITTDSLPAVEIDFTLDSDSIFSLIKNKLGQETCDQLVSFGMPYDVYEKKAISSENSILLPIQTEEFCYLIKCGVPPPGIVILMNENGDLLIDGESYTKDSILSLIPYFYLDSEDPLIAHPNNARIFLYLDFNVQKDRLEAVFTFVIDGYLEAANRLSNTWYDKDLCDLLQREAESIQEQMPFRLELGFGNKNKIPPPPPPPLEIEVD